MNFYGLKRRRKFENIYRTGNVMIRSHAAALDELNQILQLVSHNVISYLFHFYGSYFVRTIVKNKRKIVYEMLLVRIATNSKQNKKINGKVVREIR